ncbi:MAG: MBL fold metallo-hydrolase [Chitinispirillales bacterium]|jgi:glyoxylase-like metal-dependent hydrolase (beta-lactamase superfamily II)|nr:MBL fold metallo-hydrolase [Chitinispirillales bacterium]
MFRIVSKAALGAFLFLSASVAQTKSAPPLILDCGIEIVAIDEMPGREMDIELFDGPLTNEQRLRYMPGGKAPAAVHVFLVRTGGKTYLIDAGFGNAVKDGTIDPSKIEAVLITHEHGDHVGGLLREDGTANFNAPVFIAKKERDYWNDPATPNSELQKNIAGVYGNRYRTFSFGDTLAPGIVAVDASGHTPGHTAFLIGAGSTKVLIAGDFLHAAALQFPNPNESARFDINKGAAAARRRQLMEMAEANGWLIAGIHIPAPGYGRVRSNGRGGFEFTLGK